MKVGDLVKRTEKARMPEHAGFLCAETSLGLLERKQVERMPEFICVAGDRNQSWGLLSRELLLFLLRKQEDGFFEEILDRISDGVLAADSQGRIFYANPVYTEISGVPLYRLIGRMIQDVDPASILCRTLREKAPVSDGKHLVPSVRKYVDLQAYPIWKNRKFFGAVLISRDVTALHHLDQELRRRTGTVYRDSQKNDEKVSSMDGPLTDQVHAFERQVILRELEKNDWNRTQTMETLGISRRTFYRKCAELGIKEEKERAQDD